MKLKNILFLASSSLILFANPLQVAANEVATPQTQTLSSVEDSAVQVAVSSQYIGTDLQLTLTLTGVSSVKSVTGHLVTEDNQSHFLTFQAVGNSTYQVQLDGSNLSNQDILAYLKVETDANQILTFQPALVQAAKKESSNQGTSDVGSAVTSEKNDVEAQAATVGQEKTTETDSTTPTSATNGETTSLEANVATAVAPQVSQTSGNLTIANLNQTSGQFDVVVSNVSSPAGVQTVKVPVWSDQNGQDDIIWYDAAKQSDGTYKVTVKASQHKNSEGVYHAHLYYLQNDSKLVGVGATTTKIEFPKPSGNMTISNQTGGQFDVVVSEVISPYGLNAVKVPVWSDQNGQDDIVWYDAAKQSDGTYKVTVKASQHKNSEGIYHAHLYYQQADNKLVGITATSTVVTLPQPSANVAIINHTGSQFDVVVSEVVSPYGLNAVKVPVWSETNGQDDIVWYDAVKQSDGTYKVTVKANQHKNNEGTYHAHVYYIQGDNAVVGVGAVSTNLTLPQPSANVAIVNHTATQFDVVVSEVVSPYGLNAVKVPVWSEDNGQDDIVWYDAVKQSDGTYKVTVKASQHKNSNGTYHAHVYYIQGDNAVVGVGAVSTNLTLPQPSANVAIVNHTGSQFDVVVSEVVSPYGLNAVKVPVWSETNGQDDIVWYDAAKQSDGTYKVTVKASQHKNSEGAYHAHVYYIQGDNAVVGVGAVRTNLTLPQPSANVAIVNHTGSQFDVVVSEVVSPYGLNAVKVPVWSETNGQDDIVWYDAVKQSDGTYKVTIKASQHKNSDGTYHAHVYYIQGDDAVVGVGAVSTNLTLPQPSANVAIVNQTDTQFDVVVSEVVSPYGLNAVKVPVWSETNGQDDIVWYDATKQSDGTYKVTVKASQHKNSDGIYHAHVYYIQGDNAVVGVGAASTILRFSEPQAKMTVQNVDNKTGQFDVEITDVQGITEVLVPTWTDQNGQDDIVWYAATQQNDGSYKVTIASRNHNYQEGLYHIHLYGRNMQNQLVYLGATSTSVTITEKKPTASIRIENINQTYGIFEVIVSDIFAPNGVESIYVPVWSQTNGQNDIRWYEPITQSDGTYRLMVRLANHNYETGLYHAHLYLTSGGVQYGVGATTTNVTYTKQSVPSFIDVSSHNGSLSTSDYRTLLDQGVSGVVVKLTEGTSYLNPYAADQIRHARAAGLKVSVYHYSHFTSAAEAQAEARYFVAAAQSLGLPVSTVMVNDIEENKTRTNINANMKSWEEEMRRLGYSNLVHYTGASWIDVNTLGFKGPIQTDLFGIKNFWVAQYPYVAGMSLTQAGELNMHSTSAAWQFTSKAQLLAGRPLFDLNIDYTGRFTN